MDRAAEEVVSAELLLVVGTSAAVWPAAGLGEMAFHAGVPVIEINPEPTGYSERVLSIRGKAGEVLPQIAG
jgi:NAD-dependent deacetylase